MNIKSFFLRAGMLYLYLLFLEKLWSYPSWGWAHMVNLIFATMFFIKGELWLQRQEHIKH